MPGGYYLAGYTKSTGGAPTDAPYLLSGSTPVGSLSAEVLVGALSATLSFAFSGGAAALDLVSTEVVINEGGSASMDFRVEGDTRANLLFVDASQDNVGIGAAPTSGYLLHVNQAASTSGSPSAFVVTGGAHTGLATSTEAIDVLFDLARTVQFTGAPATTQRAIYVESPTYASSSAGQVLSNPVTFDIGSAPAPGTNMRFESPRALRVGMDAVNLGTASGNFNYTCVGIGNHTVTVSGNNTLSVVPGIAALSVGQVTVTSANATTFDATASIYVGGPPVDAGSAVLTNAYALWIDSGKVRLDAGGTTAQTTVEGSVLGILAGTVNGNNASSTIAVGCAVNIPVVTYTNDTATLTMTDVASLYINGVPVASTNVVFTNTALALWVGAGNTRLDGTLAINVADAATSSSTDIVTITHTTSGTAAADFGTDVVFMLEDAGGNSEEAGTLRCFAQDALAASTDSAFSFFVLRGNTLTEVARMTGGAVTSNEALMIGGGASASAMLSAIQDPDTGVYFGLSNVLSLYSGGAASLTVTTTGGVDLNKITNMTAARFAYAKGTDVASANSLTLGAGGNLFNITGSTTINNITVTNWQAGSVIMLYFAAALTVTNNAGGAGSILLSGSVNFSAGIDDTLTLAYDGTTWRELARTVI